MRYISNLNISGDAVERFLLYVPEAIFFLTVCQLATKRLAHVDIEPFAKRQRDWMSQFFTFRIPPQSEMQIMALRQADRINWVESIINTSRPCADHERLPSYSELFRTAGSFPFWIHDQQWTPSYSSARTEHKV